MMRNYNSMLLRVCETATLFAARSSNPFIHSFLLPPHARRGGKYSRRVAESHMRSRFGRMQTPHGTAAVVLAGIEVQVHSTDHAPPIVAQLVAHLSRTWRLAWRASH